LLKLLRVPAGTEVTWQAVKLYFSLRNSLTLFKRYARDFGHLCDARTFKRAKMSGHEFKDLHSQEVHSIRDDEAGELAVESYKEFYRLADLLDRGAFTSTVTFADGTQKSIEMRLQDVDKTWLNFACNCCMIERSWKLLFRRY
jgi:hypothetical protein